MAIEAQNLHQENFRRALTDLTNELQYIVGLNLSSQPADKIKNQLENQLLPLYSNLFTFLFTENNPATKETLKLLLSNQDLYSNYQSARPFLPESNTFTANLALLLTKQPESVLENFDDFINFAKLLPLDSFKGILRQLIQLLTDAQLEKIDTKINNSYNRLLSLVGGHYPYNDKQLSNLLYAFLSLKNLATNKKEDDDIIQWDLYLKARIQTQLKINLAPLYRLYKEQALRENFLIPVIGTLAAEHQKRLITQILNKINNIADPDYPADEKKQLLSIPDYIEYAIFINEQISNLSTAQPDDSGFLNTLDQTFDDLFSTNEQFEQNLAVINYFYKDAKLNHYVTQAIDRLTPLRRRELNEKMYYIIQNSRLSNEGTILLNEQSAHEELQLFYSYIKSIAESELKNDLPSLLNNLENNLTILAGLNSRNPNLAMLFTTFFSTTEIIQQREEKVQMETNELKKKNDDIKTKKKKLQNEYADLTQSAIEELENEIKLSTENLNKELIDFNQRNERFQEWHYPSDKARLNETEKMTLLNTISKIAASLSTDFLSYPEDLTQRLKIDNLYRLVTLIHKTAREDNSVQQETEKLLNLFAMLNQKFGTTPTFPNALLSSPLDDDLFKDITTRLGQNPTNNPIIHLLQTSHVKLTQIEADLINKINNQSTLNALNTTIEQLDNLIIQKFTDETNKDIAQQLENLAKIKQELIGLKQKLDAAIENLEVNYNAATKELADYHGHFTFLPLAQQQHYDSMLDSLNKDYIEKKLALQKTIEDIQQLSENNLALLSQLQATEKQWDNKEIKAKVLVKAEERRKIFEEKIAYINEKRQYVKNLALIYTIDIDNESKSHDGYIKNLEDLLKYAKLNSKPDEKLEQSKKVVEEKYKELKNKKVVIHDLVTALSSQDEMVINEINTLKKQATEEWGATVDKVIEIVTKDKEIDCPSLYNVSENELNTCYDTIKDTYETIEKAEQQANKIATDYGEKSIGSINLKSEYVTLFQQRQSFDALKKENELHVVELEEEKVRAINNAYEQQKKLITDIDNKIQALNENISQNTYPPEIKIELSDANDLIQKIAAAQTEQNNFVTSIYLQIKKSNLDNTVANEEIELENIKTIYQETLDDLSANFVPKQRRAVKEQYQSAIEELQQQKANIEQALPKDDIGNTITAAKISNFNKKWTDANSSLTQIEETLTKNLNTAKQAINQNINNTKKEFELATQSAKQQIDSIQTTLENRSIKKEKNANIRRKIAKNSLIALSLVGVALCTVVGFLGGSFIGAAIAFSISSGIVGGSTAVSSIARNRARKTQPAAARNLSSGTSENNAVQRDHSSDNDSLNGIIKQKKPAPSTPIIVAKKPKVIIYEPSNPTFTVGNRSIPTDNKQSTGSYRQFSSNNAVVAQAAQSVAAYNCNQMHHRYLAMRR